MQAPLTLHGRTQAVLDHVLDAVGQSGLPFHVVRPEHTAHHATQGMGTSIATGVAATVGAAGWLILPGDLPWIQAHSLLAAAHLLQTGADAVQVQVNGQRAHPVGFAKRHGPALQALRGDDGAKGVLRGLAVAQLALEVEGCLRDVDRPGDLGGNFELVNDAPVLAWIRPLLAVNIQTSDSQQVAYFA